MSYKEFYLRAINEHDRGLKLTLGGTGLGKTYGMRKAIKAHFKDHPKGKKVIYSTYRHQLVGEVFQELKDESVRVRYLKRDGEIIQTLVKEDRLPGMVERLARLGLFDGDLSLGEPGPRERYFDRMIHAVKARVTLLEMVPKGDPEVIDTLLSELDNHSRDLMNVFKNQLKRLGKSSPRKRDVFLKNADIWELFPYAALEHDEESSVLVATIHKLMHGFFDGRQNFKIGSIQGKLIFLDEFDFLESTILEVMTNEPNLNNPIEFVRFFYEDFDYWSAQPFWNESKVKQDMKERLSKERTRIQERLIAVKTRFPEIRHFRISESEFAGKKEIRLFQTNKLFVTKPFWLEEDNGSWYLRARKTAGSIRPHDLLRIFSRSKDGILRTFQGFYHSPSHIEDIVNFIWNSKNDGQSGVYDKYIKENLAYYRGIDQRMQVLGLNPRTFQTGYDAGYRLFKMRIGYLPMDPHGVQLEQLELLSSPEAVIGKLSDENLVFGLSATADLPRLVRCFNMDWLSKNALLLPFDSDDYRMVVALKAEKAQERMSTVAMVALDDLTANALFVSKLGMLDRIGFFQNEEENDSTSAQYRKDRVLDALKCLEWITELSENRSHLMFLSTFRHLRMLLTGEGLGGDAKVTWNGTIHCEKIGKAGYRIRLGAKSIAVAFLNAESSRKMSDEEYLSEYKGLFAEERFVLITQYQSASNGVNLLCLDKDGTEVDFGGIHLIESQPFWLPRPEGKRFEQPVEKQMIWYLWKLMEAGALGEGRFRECLETDHFPQVGQAYKQMPDHTLNQVALFHQSIGRVERKRWKTGVVEVSLGNTVYAELSRYLTDPKFLTIRQERIDTTSGLIDLIHEAILNDRTPGVQAPKQSIGQVQEKAKATVELLLEALKLVRNGGVDSHEASEIRRIWEGFRQAVLQHDFAARWTLPLGSGMAADITMSSLVVHLDGGMGVDRLHLDMQGGLLRNGPQAGWQRWDLATPFATGNQAVIRNALSRQSVSHSPSEIASTTGQLWAPYIFQSVLKGRWGEVAIHALLDHYQVKLCSSRDIPDELYELIDFRLEGHPVYIDCKHYNAATQWQFGLGPSDPGYDPAFDSRRFLESLGRRLATIRRHGGIGSSAKLFVVNVACLSTIAPKYYDEKLRPVVGPSECAIGIIPGAMDADAGYEVSAGLQDLVHYFQSLS